MIAFGAAAWVGYRLAEHPLRTGFALRPVPPRIVPAFGMGLVGGWLVVRGGSLWPGLALHMGYNALAGFALAPLLSSFGREGLTLATNGVLPLPLGWLVAAGAGLSALGVVLTHRMLPASEPAPA